MQTISAYLLEKGGLSREQRLERIRRIHGSIDKWLLDKGVADPGEISGNFVSETKDGGGAFSREFVEVDDEYVEVVALQEKANQDQLYLTKISVASKGDRVIVHASVSATNIGTTIAPRFTSARCPFVIRDLIREHHDWVVTGAPVPSGRPRDVVGIEGGDDLVRIITSTRRKFPLVLVSEDQGEFVWDGLDRKLAYDLAGIGYVSAVDADAGRQVSKRLGRGYACFGGAVRLYWPAFGGAFNSVESQLWTPERMLDAPSEANAEDRFRESVRRRVMSVSALAITEPRELGEIQRASTRRKIKELQASSADLNEVYEIANSLADELDGAKRRVADLDEEISILTTRAENAEAQLAAARHSSTANADDLCDADSAEDGADDAEDASAIQEGQIVFYKKVDSAPHHDIMVRRGDCGHNSWAGAHAADKAWKGVARLERREDWKSFMHCSRCKGGGVWKVSW